MSTIRVDTVSNTAASQSTGISNVINGSAKAWVNFNGTGTVAIRASHNVSSITDNGTGIYTVNFASALADANYSVSSIVTDNNIGEAVIKISAAGSTSAPTTMTSSAVRLALGGVGNTYDANVFCVTVLR